MTSVIVNDASCLIDLRKGKLLHMIQQLPYRFVIPLPIRYSEILNFTGQEWQLLDDGGMETFDLPPKQIAEAFEIKSNHTRLSANDCFCIVSTQSFEDGILLTGDRLLKRVAKEAGLRTHGVLWIIDELDTANVCRKELLISALEIWRNDDSVFLPENLIEERLQNLHQT